MIFNVGLDVMKQLMSLEAGLTYFYEAEDRIELYVPQGGIILKSTYFKVGGEQDLIWKDDNLKKAIRVISVEKSPITLNISTS